MSAFYMSVFRIETGEIVGSFKYSCEESYIQSTIANAVSAFGDHDHAAILQAADPAIHYVVMMDETPVAVERPPIPYQIDRLDLTAGTGDFITITGLHNPCELIIDNPDPTVETWSVTVEDGGFEFEADTPGVYTIEISRFPFLPARIEITAT